MYFGRTIILFIVLSRATSSQINHRRVSCSEVPNTSCANDLQTLEKILLQTSNNKIELLKAFYQPRQPPATFVTVNYTFLNEEEHVICNKLWMWSSAVFYLIEPPHCIQVHIIVFCNTICHNSQYSFQKRMSRFGDME